jgi:FtsH-binding integral membrane protein
MGFLVRNAILMFECLKMLVMYSTRFFACVSEGGPFEVWCWWGCFVLPSVCGDFLWSDRKCVIVSYVLDYVFFLYIFIQSQQLIALGYTKCQ